MKRLENKTAVIYGDGATGTAMAKAFAMAGARVFFTGRTPSRLENTAKEIVSSGGIIETAQLDALDEQAVEQHMKEVIKKTGWIDISYNAIGIPQKGIQGPSLIDLPLDSFMLPVTTYLASHFITARTAARRMTRQGFGVILMHTPNASRVSPPFVGGMAPAWASLESLCRSFSSEYGQSGVRAVCLHTTGIPETPLIDEVWSIHGKSHGTSYEDFNKAMEERTHRRKLTTLTELTNAAVFAASDEGSAISGTIFNLTAGMNV